MPLSHLETLPLEVLQQISGMLDNRYQPSVRYLSLTSHQCRCAAIPVLFHSLHIHVKDAHQLTAQVNTMATSLESMGVLRHIRQLRVTGDLHATSHKTVPPPSYRDDPAWEPLARFIEQMPCLEDLVYACRTQFPPCMLAILHDRPRSTCRLHLHKFSLASVVVSPESDVGEPFSLDPRERDLVLSPNLHAIRALSSFYTADGRVNYLKDAVDQLVAGHNPSLKEVTHLRKKRPRKAADRLAMREIADKVFIPPWPGMLLRNGQHPPKAELTSLTIGTRGGTEIPKLMDWQERINTDALKSLKLIDAILRRTLSWLIRHMSFASLAVLQMKLPSDSQELVGRLLDKLPLLEDLTLRGSFSHGIPPELCERLGGTLHRLVLPDRLCSIWEVRELASWCSALEELEIKIPRSGGNADEVMFYDRLGIHNRLQHISLTLDCTVDASAFNTPLPTDAFGLEKFEWRGREHSDIRNGHIRQSLTNSAVDQALAVAIFNRIAAANPPAGLLLERLDLRLRNAGKVVNQYVLSSHDERAKHRMVGDPIFEHMSQPWVVTRHSRHDSEDEIIANRDHTKQIEEARDPDESEDEAPEPEPEPDDRTRDLLQRAGLKAVFYNLWPEGASGDPRDDWHSFPLADGEND